jgi:hypothetical protein
VSVQLVAWAYQQKVGSHTEKAVLVALANAANHQTGRCHPKIARLAEETECGESTVRKCLSSLAAKGLIRRDRTRRADGSFGVYHYLFPEVTVTADPLPERTPALGDSGGPALLGSGQEPEEDLEPEVKEEKANAFSKKVQRIYDHWRSQRGKTRSNYERMSPARRQKIQARLKEFSEDELIAAIDAIASDPWPDRSLHDDLTVVFRSREQVERFLEMRSERSSAKERAEAWLRNVGWQYEDEAIWEDLGKFGLTEDERRELALLTPQLQQDRAA